MASDRRGRVGIKTQICLIFGTILLIVLIALGALVLKNRGDKAEMKLIRKNRKRYAQNFGQGNFEVVLMQSTLFSRDIFSFGLEGFWGQPQGPNFPSP